MCLFDPLRDRDDIRVAVVLAELLAYLLLLGISRTKVEQLRTLNDHASDEVKEAVKDGKLSINKAYKATMDARHATKAENSDPEQIKADRLLALETSYCSALTTRTDRELKQYP